MIMQEEFNTIREGDQVMFTTDLSIARRTEGWIDGMQKILGKTGTVTGILYSEGIPYGIRIKENMCWYHRDTIEYIVTATKKPTKIKISTKSLF